MGENGGKANLLINLPNLVLSSVLERHVGLKFTGLIQQVVKAECSGDFRRMLKLEGVVEWIWNEFKVDG